MSRLRLGFVAVAVGPCVAALIWAGSRAAPDAPQRPVRYIVDSTVRSLMAKDGIPGVAVGIAIGGSNFVFDYGVASKQSRRPVTRETLFEIGSVSKTFTATLASLAQVEHRLSLSDDTAKYLPYLRGSPFGQVILLDLATHTPGGLPLQVPAGITTEDQLLEYLKRWRPAYPPGTYRTYSNVGIGTLGIIAAKSMGDDFRALMERRLFRALGMTNSFITVPAAGAADYAQGYTSGGTPIRMSPGVLWAEAYGVRSTAADLVRFLQANMGLIDVGVGLQRALTQTHTGYFQAGPMTQDLIWEQFPYPVSLSALLEGNSRRMLFDATPVTQISPPEAPREDVWINKTGSTNGFSAYVAFVPGKRLGVVLLANKSFPIADRVTAAYRILTALAKD